MNFEAQIKVMKLLGDIKMKLNDLANQVGHPSLEEWMKGEEK